jgi:hypothetical protein
MLPGFRFLFAAILLSTSILVFGLGAAALLRAAHEEVASIPTRRGPPEPVFARQDEPTQPTLALLRVEPPEQPAQDPVPAADPPAEQVSDAAPAVEPDKLAALKAGETAPPEAAKPEEMPLSETPPEVQAAPDPAETPAARAAPGQAEAPTAADEPKLAAIADTRPPASEAAAAEPESTAAPVLPEISPASSKIATLGGPAVTIGEAASAKAKDAKPRRSAVTKRVPAQPPNKRRPKVQRAQPAPRAVAQQLPNPFTLPTITRRTQ